MFNNPIKKIPVKKEEIRVSDLVKEGQEGFKINFTKLKQSIKKCELNKSKEDCQRIFRDMGIDVVGEE